MKTTKTKVWIPVSLFLLVATCPVALADPAAAEGWYVGASAGRTMADVDCDLNITCSDDETDTGFKLFGAKQFNRVAIEFGYADLGEFTLSGTDTLLGNVSASVQAKALFATANGVLPLGQRVNVFGKVGIHRWDLDAKASSSVSGSSSEKDDGFEFLFGIGASFDVGKSVAIRVEWESFNDVGDEDTTGEGDVGMLSVGATFKF